jgi:uncharacterized membrane-anchored protein
MLYMYVCMYVFMYVGIHRCPKSRFNKTVKCLTVIIFICVQINIATMWLLWHVFLSAVVLLVYTPYLVINKVAFLLERKYNIGKETFRTPSIYIYIYGGGGWCPVRAKRESG